MKKHAYLIIANRNPQQLQDLITMIDDSRNDIYLLIDKKSHLQYNFVTDYSTLNYLAPINIYWGDYSQIQAEINLFSAAIHSHYSYYHLLSGLDLPLENQDNIHNFFDKHPNREFIGYGNPNKINEIYSWRIKPHFIGFCRKRLQSHNFFIRKFNGLEKRILKLLPENKINKDKIGYASQWLTVDDELANLIVRSRRWIKYIFKYGELVDEVFIPTLVNYYPNILNKSYYKEPDISNTGTFNGLNEFKGNLRFIKFVHYNSPSPVVWTIKDYKSLMIARKKGYLFARKFDDHVDNKIILKIFNDVIN